MGVVDRLYHAWNAFQNPESVDPAQSFSSAFSSSYGSMRPDRTRRVTGDRSIISSIYTRIGIDVAAIDIQHVKVDDNGQYADTIQSGLNNCLTVEANIDQASRAFMQDVAMSLFENGVIAIVPIETTLDPTVSASYDIKTMRVGIITAWYPTKVRVNVYNEKLGIKQEIVLDKSYVSVVENPLFSVMNEPNGTLQRLIRSLNILDQIDEQAGSGKLDMIIQLPYVIKSEARKEQAEARRKDIEVQLKGSQYGIAYTDGTERITQLNRPVENNMLDKITWLTTQLYAQLGLTEEVFNGTATDAVMLNYYNRTIEPILSAISQAMIRTFLTKTARTQGQSILFFRDPFKLMPISDIADIADKLSRNEILSSNEIRAKIGFRPSSDPKANQLVNSNMPQPSALPAGSQPPLDRGQLTATPTAADDPGQDAPLSPGDVPVSQLTS